MPKIRAAQNRVIRGTEVLKQGASGPAVRALQEQLRAAGWELEVSGRFTSETARCVREFQSLAGLPPDGIVGAKTRAALGEGRVQRPVTSTPDGPPSEDPAEPGSFGYYADLVRKAGGQVNPKGMPTVLGIRSLKPGDGLSSSLRYDDAFVVLTRDGRVEEFRGATHPSMKKSTDAPDVDGDGAGDVGMIKPGNYLCTPREGPFMGTHAFRVQTTTGSGRIPGWRDYNQDGFFDANEQQRSTKQRDGLTGVLFHVGMPHGPLSVGCQTMAPNGYARFIESVGGPKARFTFTLIDAAP